jgi:hypothetical protein
MRPPFDPVTVDDLWSLRADPPRLVVAAGAWRALSARVRDARGHIDQRAVALRADRWSGDTAETYHRHRERLGGDLEGAATLADTLAGELDATAGLLRRGQDLLADAWARIAVPVSRAGGTVTFHPRRDADLALVDAAVREATAIRGDVDRELPAHRVVFEDTIAGWSRIAGDWARVAQGIDDGWRLPAEAGAGVLWIVDGDRVVLDTGTGNDTVFVRLDPKTGEQVVSVNGRDYRFAGSTVLTVRTGEGNDTVSVASGTRVALTLISGEGDDRVNGGWGDDVILGLDGRDHLEGGPGNDTVHAGAGDDVVYALSGDDRVRGGEGDDYLDGGHGRDDIDGGAGRDVLSGGQDDDTLDGGADDDTVYNGFGRDAVLASGGADTAYAQPDDAVASGVHTVTVQLADVGSYIRVEGSPEFVERVQSDLEMLRGSPRGQLMLGDLQQVHEASKGWFYGGDGLTISEYTAGNNSMAYDDRDWLFHHHPAIAYAPAVDVAGGPPVAILYHEMAHIFDFEHGTSADGTYHDAAHPDLMPDGSGAPNRERQAVGLPFDDDGDPSTPTRIDPLHPFAYTENGLREEMGVKPRTSYGQR